MGTERFNQGKHGHIWKNLETSERGHYYWPKEVSISHLFPKSIEGNSVWMFASKVELTVDNIRTGLKDFRQIRNVAKYAARLGQSFSSSREVWKYAVSVWMILKLFLMSRLEHVESIMCPLMGLGKSQMV
ncbi:hypothetical protein Vadar_001623 [Vaccinium darrowii]|uniref:Uncharacterized protein n=1 Tax=Vaccinium darrowii TaxID=229202 RepID=A0ACB7XMF1_9ERIC|nr:hypothetical protein Vadar_001623 [Vaccinium darrowii]